MTNKWIPPEEDNYEVKQKNSGVYMKHKWIYVTEESANHMPRSADCRLHQLQTAGVGWVVNWQLSHSNTVSQKGPT